MRLGLTITALIVFGPLMRNTDADAAANLRFAHTLPVDSPWGQAVTELARDVEARLQGQLKLDVFPASSLGSASELAEYLQTGNLDLALLPISVVARKSQEFRVYEVPFLFEDLGAVSRFQASKAGVTMLQLLPSLGLKGFAYWHDSMKVLSSSKKQIMLPNDLKGAKLGSTGIAALIAPEFARLGATVVQNTQAGNLLPDVLQGLVDTIDTTPLFLLQSRVFQVQQFVTFTNHVYLGYVLAASQKGWDRLSPQLRNEVEQSITQFTPRANTNIVSNLGQGIKSLSNNLTVRVLSRDQREAWRASMSSSWQDFSKTQANKELLNAAVAAGGTGGGGEPCSDTTECRCGNRTCSTTCCTRGAP
jgi:C4-dicarboxylate-binding protein DctP